MPVTNVHMMGDIEVMGDGGLAWLKEEAGLGARCAVGTHSEPTSAVSTRHSGKSSTS